jgi:hypothetical protein
MNGFPPEELIDLTDKILVNRVAFQRPSTTLCGYYSICFALVMELFDHDLTQKEFESALYQSII